MRRTSCLIALVLAGACSSGADPDPVDSTDPNGGKGDVFETEMIECTAGSPWSLDSSTDLVDAIQTETSYTEADIDTLDEVTANQLFDAVVHLGFLQESERFDLLFSADDEGRMQLLDLTIDDEDYDWVRFYAGDTEVGVIFADNTSDVVAEVSDGDLQVCETVPGPLMSDVPICSYDDEWVADNSADLREFSRSVDELDIVGASVSRHKRQIELAMFYLELIDENGDIFDAMDAVDDERVTIVELELEDETRFDWVSAHAGDTEVGIVFEAESTRVVAEVSDGDVLGCTNIVSE